MLWFKGLSLCFILILPCSLWSQVDWSTQFSADPWGADSLLRTLLTADEEAREKISECLLPTREDCAALLQDPKMGRSLYRFQQHLRRHEPLVIQPLHPNQTQLRLWVATTEELDRYEGEARHFPGGYHELAPYLRPDLTLYRFKYVEPGRRLGSAYDVLVYLNGHWRMIHRPWVILFH